MLVAVLAVVLMQEKAEEKLPENCIVIYNCHNGAEANTGCKEINVYLLAKSGTKLWIKKNVKTAWSPDKDVVTVIPFSLKNPDAKVAKVRIEITKWVQQCPGVTEVQVWRNKELVSADKLVAVSGTPSKTDSRNADGINDGVLTSSREGKGYWLGQLNKPGWIEIDFTRERGETTR